MRIDAAVLVGAAALEILCAGDLELLVEIVEGVEDDVLIGDVHDLAIGEDLAHAVGEGLPFLRAVEVVDHEEAAAEEILA